MALPIIGTLFPQLDLKQLIRIIVIIGGYMLLRPHLAKIAERIQAKDHARVVDDEAAQSLLSGNRIVEVDSDEEVQKGQWGARQKKRVKSRQKKIVEMEESDSEIDESLLMD